MKLVIRRTLLVSLVALSGLSLLSGCAAIWPAETITITSGQSHCSSSDKATCDKLHAVAASLDTPEMRAAIAEARKHKM